MSCPDTNFRVNQMMNSIFPNRSVPGVFQKATLCTKLQVNRTINSTTNRTLAHWDVQSFTAQMVAYNGSNVPQGPKYHKEKVYRSDRSNELS